MRRWLVTGGCGFLGRNLVRELSKRGRDEVRVVDNLHVGSRQDLLAIAPLRDPSAGEDGLATLEFTPGDILDATAMRVAARGRDIVVHLAANTGVAPSVADPWNDCTVNVMGTLTCLEAARHEKVRRFIFASSGAPLGEVEPPIDEEKVPRPVSPYGASKLAGEGYCCAYHRTFGVGTVVLRFGNVYGPYSAHKSSVVAAFIQCALAGEALVIHGDGRQTRDFIFVEDLVQAILRAAAAPEAAGHVFQIATSRETTIIELAELLVDVLGERGVTGRITYGPRRTGDVTRNFSDTSKALRVLGWRAEVSLREGLSRTVDWFMAHAGAPSAHALPPTHRLV